MIMFRVQLYLHTAAAGAASRLPRWLACVQVGSDLVPGLQWPLLAAVAGCVLLTTAVLCPPADEESSPQPLG